VAVPNALYAAYIPQLGAMTTREVDIKEGRAVAPTEPGLGIAWDHDAIARLRVA
jgi:L-alanine-DL-glutamate epimerase-like enolase superfamily enzyme